MLRSLLPAFDRTKAQVWEANAGPSTRWWKGRDTGNRLSSETELCGNKPTVLNAQAGRLKGGALVWEKIALKEKKRE